MNQVLIELKLNIESNRKATGNCPFCNIIIKPDDFKDDKSKREFEQSGLCQSCQDGFFD